LTCPTEDEYLEMVANKTGGLFRLAVKLMQAESETEQYVSRLSYLLAHK
jgi:geranylgeranyl diphosphate synthase, type III